MKLRTWKCQKCGKWYQHDDDGPQYSCTVLHSDGHCHQFDTELADAYERYGSNLGKSLP